MALRAVVRLGEVVLQATECDHDLNPFLYPAKSLAIACGKTPKCELVMFPSAWRNSLGFDSLCTHASQACTFRAIHGPYVGDEAENFWADVFGR